MTQTYYVEKIVKRFIIQNPIFKAIPSLPGSNAKLNGYPKKVYQEETKEVPY